MLKILTSRLFIITVKLGVIYWYASTTSIPSSGICMALLIL